MKIIVAGTGYVGLVHAAVSSEFGHEVYAYDNNPDKIKAFASCEADQIVRYVNEPGFVNLPGDDLGRNDQFGHQRGKGPRRLWILPLLFQNMLGNGDTQTFLFHNVPPSSFQANLNDRT